MVKAALGSEAVILATREVSNGLFRPKEIEVTAALPEPGPVSKALPHHAYVPLRTPPPTTSGANAMTAAALNTGRAVAPPNLTPSRSNTEELLDLRSAMEDMRREMRGVSQQVRTERELKLPPNAAELYGHLVNRGVEEALAQDAVRQAVEEAPNGSTHTLLASLRTALDGRVAVSTAPWLPETARQRVVALVGPTGVGKTTTLAKVAARAIMEQKLKVALITVDTYRIGASEQVMRYGEIMSIPTFVARDRIELTRSLEKCGNADLVLVDTAGRSVSEAVARQAEMLRAIEGIELYLVMSACTGPREMAAAAERYRALKPERLIVTKTDEAVGPGSLLSASVRIGRPIVAVADGQRVPEDIHSLSSVELIDLIIGPFQSSRPDTTLNVGGR
jgi:flagellar biosynthesis protein FlhF